MSITPLSPRESNDQQRRPTSSSQPPKLSPKHPYQKAPPTKSKGGLLVLAGLLAICGVGYALYHFHGSTQQVRERMVVDAARRNTLVPEPTPTRLAVFTPMPTATPAPAPTLTSIVTPAPTRDPRAWLLEHRERAPKEVTLAATQVFPGVVDGKVVGSVEALAGTRVGVVDVQPQSIGVVFQGGGKRLPYEATNLLELVKLEMSRPEPVSRLQRESPPSPSPVAQSASAPRPSSAAKLILVKEFVHPGVVLTKANLAAMEHGVRENREPWVSWFKQYDGDPGTVGNEGQYEEYGRNPDVHRGEFQSDMWQLYRMALQWVVKKDKRAAERGVGILENYAKHHKNFGGVEGSFLQGDCLHGIIAAEILRSTYPGWTEENTAHIQQYFANVWWGPLRIGKDNSGAGSHLWTANQGTIGLKVAMALSIFCDDPVRFNMCVNAYLTDPLTGLEDSLPNGEVGDSGRDCGHWTAECIDNGWICQLAWAQGIDLFEQRTNRIVAISEFLAQNQLYKLGFCKENARFIPFGCSYEFYTEVAPFDNVRGREFFDVIDTYARRKHIPAPFTHELLRRENYKGPYTLDDSIKAKPVVAPWTPPATTPVSNLHSANVGTSKGSTEHAGNVWKLHGESKEDSYHFAYQEVEGDCVLVARVLDTGGIMMTDSLKPTGAARAVWFEADPKGSCVHWSHGAHSYLLPWDLKYFGGPKTPLWLKLVRRGYFIAAYQSVDGTSWSPSANVLFEWGGLPEKIYVGLITRNGYSSFDSAAIGTGPNTVPTAPKDVGGSVKSNQARLSWKSDSNTVFCDVLRAEQKGGPYKTVAERVAGETFTDKNLNHGASYFYVISPAGYSGRGVDSKELRVDIL